jgi:hypothetical protein
VIAVGAALCKFNGGKERCEVCADCAVVQGTRDSGGNSCWRGKIMMSGGQRKTVDAGNCCGEDREMRSEPERAKNPSLRESFHAASGGERSSISEGERLSTIAIGAPH